MAAVSGVLIFIWVAFFIWVASGLLPRFDPCRRCVAARCRGLRVGGSSGWAMAAVRGAVRGSFRPAAQARSLQALHGSALQGAACGWQHLNQRAIPNLVADDGQGLASPHPCVPLDVKFSCHLHPSDPDSPGRPHTSASPLALLRCWALPRTLKQHHPGCAYTCARAHTHTYTYIHACMFTNTHTHTCTQAPAPSRCCVAGPCLVRCRQQQHPGCVWVCVLGSMCSKSTHACACAHAHTYIHIHACTQLRAHTRHPLAEVHDLPHVARPQVLQGLSTPVRLQWDCDAWGCMRCVFMCVGV